jgi:hypothetical protein
MTTTLPEASLPYRTSSPGQSDILAFTPGEMHAAMLRPDRAIDLLLTDRDRLGRTLGEGRHLARLGLVMLVSTAVLALPFGIVLGLHHAFAASFLFLGSVAICFPSLHVFCCYLGARMSVSQALGLSLVTSSVASFFALGFAPILWLVRATTPGGSLVVGVVTSVLLSIALLAGLAHLARTVLGESLLLPRPGQRFLLFVWQGLVLFVASRLAQVLGLA